MQNISLQKSILYTILHFVLCCAIAAGCPWCKKDKDKKQVDKSTKITIVTQPIATPQEKADSKEATPDDPVRDALDATDNDEDEDKNEEKEKEQEAEYLKEMLNQLDNVLQEDIDPGKDSVEVESSSKPLPSAPPAYDEYNKNYTQDDLPPSYSLEPGEDKYDPDNKSLNSSPNPTSSTQGQKSGFIQKLIQICKKTEQKDRKGLREKIYKIKLNLKSFIKPIDELIKDLEKLENKRNRYKQLVKVRKNDGIHPDILDEKDQELLAQYARKSHASLNLKIQKLRLHIGLLKMLIQNKQQKEEKKIGKLTHKLEALENKRTTCNEFLNLLKLRDIYGYDILNPKMSKSIADTENKYRPLEEHLTEEEIQSNIKKWEQLLKDKEGVSNEVIELKITNLTKQIKSLNETLKKKKKNKEAMEKIVNHI